ncbi:MAG: helix-turn-helix domain-containing protein [Phycisphaerales bacterium]
MESINYPLLAKLVAENIRVVPEWLSPQQAAAYTGIPEGTLEQRRREGTGPAYSRVGRHVRYKREFLDAWLLAQEVIHVA